MHTKNYRRSACLLITLVLAAAWSAPALADLWALNVDSNHTAPAGSEDAYNNVLRFAVNGDQLIGLNGIPHGHSLADPYPLLPVGIAVGPDGNVYVSDAGGGRILRYNGTTGAPVGTGVFEQLTDAAPSTLAFGPDGNLYMSEFFGPTVRVYNPTTGARLTDAATGLESAGGLAFASNGDLLVGDGFVMAAGQSAQIVRVHNGAADDVRSKRAWDFLSSPVALLTLKDDRCWRSIWKAIMWHASLRTGPFWDHLRSFRRGPDPAAGPVQQFSVGHRASIPMGILLCPSWG